MELITLVALHVFVMITSINFSGKFVLCLKNLQLHTFIFCLQLFSVM